MNSALFENETLRIVPFEKQHLTSQYVGWLNDPEVVQFSEQRHTKHTIKSCISYFNKQTISNNLFLAIEFKSSNKTIQHIGNIGVFITRLSAFSIFVIMIGAFYLAHSDWFINENLFKSEQIYIFVLSIFFLINGNNR